MSDKPGPYVSEDFAHLYLPVAAYSYHEARTEAAAWAAEFIDVWGRSRYAGKREVPMHDHADWEACHDCPARPAWCFDIYEGTPRWTA